MVGKLSALKIKALTTPGRYGDGDGLWLQVRDAGHRSWLFRYTLHGRAREMGLGPADEVSLAEARQAAADCRRFLREGVDPIERRREAKAEAAAKAQAFTFRQVAQRYHAAHKSSWRNAKHRDQWLSTMEAYIYPVFGDRLAASVTTGDVMRALEPIWWDKSMTANVLRGRIEAVLDYAKARDWRTGENPARWRGHLANLLPARNRIAKIEHHPALPWQEIGAFMARIRSLDDLAARALELLILTATRTNEVMGAMWQEIDLEAAVWTIPGNRMKAGREHRVPLSVPALALLKGLAAIRRGDEPFVFPSPRKGQPMSNRACAMMLKRLKRQDLTVHGFRSTFRDWAAEQTNYPREVAEGALAHTLENRVEAAYRRSDLLQKRARLMEDWGKFCSRPFQAGKVVPMAKGRSGR